MNEAQAKVFLADSGCKEPKEQDAVLAFMDKFNIRFGELIPDTQAKNIVKLSKCQKGLEAIRAKDTDIASFMRLARYQPGDFNNLVQILEQAQGLRVIGVLGGDVISMVHAQTNGVKELAEKLKFAGQNAQSFEQDLSDPKDRKDLVLGRSLTVLQEFVAKGTQTDEPRIVGGVPKKRRDKARAGGGAELG
jgi:hypothetical protein